MSAGDDGLTETEAGSRPTTWRFGGEQDVVDAFQIFLRNAAAIVTNLEDCVPIIMGRGGLRSAPAPRYPDLEWRGRHW